MTQFSEKLELLFHDLLSQGFGERIKQNIREFSEDTDALERNPDYPKALGRIAELIITRSWYYRSPNGFHEQFNEYVNRREITGSERLKERKNFWSL